MVTIGVDLLLGTDPRRGPVDADEGDDMGADSGLMRLCYIEMNMLMRRLGGFVVYT